MRYVGPRHIVIDDRPAPAPFWIPDRAFAGLTVTIVGGGPSHARFDLDLLRWRRFIAVNSACRRLRDIATGADPLFFHDNSWAENRPELIADWPGPVMTSNRHAKARLGDRVQYIDMTALTEHMAALPDHVGASSGHTAACLAALMGARRIVLIGFECRAVDGRTHGHGDYSHHDIGVYAEQFLPGWRGLAPAFDRLGVEIVNATPGSAIEEFPVAELSDVLRGMN